MCHDVPMTRQPSLRTLPLTPAPLCLERDTPLLDALQRMLERGVDELPVCEGGVWKGFVSVDVLLDALLAHGERALPDLRTADDPMAVVARHVEAFAGLTVGHLVRRDLPALDEDTPLLEAALLLRRHGKPLPIVGSGGRYKGMLSRRTLLGYPARPARH